MFIGGTMPNEMRFCSHGNRSWIPFFNSAASMLPAAIHLMMRTDSRLILQPWPTIRVASWRASLIFADYQQAVNPH